MIKLLWKIFLSIKLFFSLDPLIDNNVIKQPIDFKVNRLDVICCGWGDRIRAILKHNVPGEKLLINMGPCSELTQNVFSYLFPGFYILESKTCETIVSFEQNSNILVSSNSSSGYGKCIDFKNWKYQCSAHYRHHFLHISFVLLPVAHMILFSCRKHINMYFTYISGATLQNCIAILIM